MAKKTRKSHRKDAPPPPDLAPPSRYLEWRDFFFGQYGKQDDFIAVVWEHDFDSSTMAASFAYCAKRAGSELSAFDDWQLGHGLNALLNFHCVHDIIDGSTSDDAKRAVISSLGPLYGDCLAKRSPPVLGHRNEGSGTPLEFITYMLWDISALTSWIGVTNPATGQSLLIETLGEVLCARPNNPSCIESVLHGFGHMICAHRAQAEYVAHMQAEIDRFITTRPILRPELSAYAAAAYSGCVQ